MHEKAKRIAQAETTTWYCRYRHSHLQQGFQGYPVLLESRVAESAYDLYDHEQGGVR